MNKKEKLRIRKKNEKIYKFKNDKKKKRRMRKRENLRIRKKSRMRYKLGRQDENWRKKK